MRVKGRRLKQSLENPGFPLCRKKVDRIPVEGNRVAGMPERKAGKKKGVPYKMVSRGRGSVQGKAAKKTRGLGKRMSREGGRTAEEGGSKKGEGKKGNPYLRNQLKEPSPLSGYGVSGKSLQARRETEGLLKGEGIRATSGVCGKDGPGEKVHCRKKEEALRGRKADVVTSFS